MPRRVGQLPVVAVGANKLPILGLVVVVQLHDLGLDEHLGAEAEVRVAVLVEHHNPLVVEGARHHPQHVPLLLRPPSLRREGLQEGRGGVLEYQRLPSLQHARLKSVSLGDLENDPIVDSLLAENPFRGKAPPKHVRARLVRDGYCNHDRHACFRMM